ncbi:hypothetical protein MTR_2g075310 [Medicago truncatula]|uniref:Uncharacterized protein n=1 Tax=Medicago truncatula TaxID=3880 RepID=G7IQZ8_MEDTR|nr:hypothetical protein MTR_2g075310 [Medicago truncatula]
MRNYPLCFHSFYQYNLHFCNFTSIRFARRLHGSSYPFCISTKEADQVPIMQNQNIAAPVPAVVALGEERTIVYIGRRLILLCGATAVVGNYIGNI